MTSHTYIELALMVHDAISAAADELAPAHTARLVTAALTDGTSVHGALAEAGVL